MYLSNGNSYSKNNIYTYFFSYRGFYVTVSQRQFRTFASSAVDCMHIIILKIVLRVSRPFLKISIDFKQSLQFDMETRRLYLFLPFPNIQSTQK